MRSRGPAAIFGLATSMALLWSVRTDWVIPAIFSGLVTYVSRDGAEWLAERLGRPIRGA